MRHQIELWRDDELMFSAIHPSEEKAMSALDEATTIAHGAIFGVGSFHFVVSELAPEGHVEKIILETKPFSVPRHISETA